ncbi:MAG: hypothetical protein ABUL68_00455 [Pseudomonadota bacterium]
MKLPPLLAGFIRFLLIAIGTTAVLSAVVEIISAVSLLEPGDEEAMGVSRNFLVVEYGVQLLAGAAMLFFGFRWRK